MHEHFDKSSPKLNTFSLKQGRRNFINEIEYVLDIINKGYLPFWLKCDPKEISNFKTCKILRRKHSNGENAKNQNKVSIILYSSISNQTIDSCNDSPHRFFKFF